MRHPRVVLLVGVVTALVLATGPLLASDPSSHQLTVPTADGETVTVEWTGVIPPGAETDSD